MADEVLLFTPSEGGSEVEVGADLAEVRQLAVDWQTCTATPFRIEWGIQCLVLSAQTEVCREYSSRGR